MASHIKKDDLVEVISGAHKGERGKVLMIIRDRDQVLIEGVNMVYRHVKPSQRNPQGGRLQKEAPIHMSNALPVDPKTGRGSRVRFEIETDGHGKVVKKRRVTIGGTVLSEVTKAEAGS
jgi:large subunit ribosomal protein L24